MRNLLLRKRWTLWKKRFAAVAIGAGMLCGGLFPAVASALDVAGPGLAMIIDGNDPGDHVATFNIDATMRPRDYDFGFVDASGFTPIALNPSGPASLFGSYTFDGGTLVDFALRNNTSGSIYSIADPNDYANQIYLDPIDPSFSSHPPVSFTYYNTLVLQWDLDNNGSTDAGFTITSAVDPHDGFAPAPVPIPASLFLFGSGIISLIGLARTRYSAVVCP